MTKTCFFLRNQQLFQYLLSCLYNCIGFVHPINLCLCVTQEKPQQWQCMNHAEEWFTCQLPWQLQLLSTYEVLKCQTQNCLGYQTFRKRRKKNIYSSPPSSGQTSQQQHFGFQADWNSMRSNDFNVYSIFWPILLSRICKSLQSKHVPTSFCPLFHLQVIHLNNRIFFHPGQR